MSLHPQDASTPEVMRQRAWGRMPWARPVRRASCRTIRLDQRGLLLLAGLAINLGLWGAFAWVAW